MQRLSTEEVPLLAVPPCGAVPGKMHMNLGDLRALAAAISPVIIDVEGLPVGDTVTVLRLQGGNYTVYSDMAGRTRIPASLLETAFMVAGNVAYLGARA